MGSPIRNRTQIPDPADALVPTTQHEPPGMRKRPGMPLAGCVAGQDFVQGLPPFFHVLFRDWERNGFMENAGSGTDQHETIRLLMNFPTACGIHDGFSWD